MEDKSKILEEETDKILEGVEEIEEVFTKLEENPIVELVASTNFFTLRALECTKLIVNCFKALAALPLVTPPICKIRRSQYIEIRDRLNSLKTSFTELQGNLNILIPLVSPQRPLTATEQAVKTSNLSAIALKIPDVFTDVTFMKLECERIKKAREF